MQLIDVDALKEKEQYIPCGNGLLFHGVTAATIDAMPTIDPETLPIVRELREKLERVTEERDAAIEDLRLFGHKCNCCKHFDRPFTCIAPEPCGVNDNWEWRGPVAENATTDTSTEEGVNQ